MPIKIRRFLIIFNVALGLACICSIIALSDQRFGPIAVVEVDAAIVTVGAINRFEYSTGRVIAVDSRKLSFSQSGMLQKLFVNAGDYVRAGDVMAELASDADQVEKIGSANVELIASDRRVQIAKETLHQDRDLFTAGIISATAQQKSEQALANEQDRQQHAVLALRASQQKSALTRLRADTEAQVVATDMVQGQSITATQSITLVNPFRLAIEARVDETIAAQLKPGQEARYTFAAKDDKKVKGSSVVTFIYPSFDAAADGTNPSTNSGVKIRVDIAPAHLSLLRVNQQVQLSLLAQAKPQATLVPSNAIVVDHGLQYVLILANTKVQWLSIETGIEQADVTEVISPSLAAGTRIVVPTPGLTPPINGQLVKVRLP